MERLLSIVSRPSVLRNPSNCHSIGGAYRYLVVMAKTDRNIFGAGRRVLVVDDHDDFREAMWLLLESLGFRAAVADNGIEALKRLKTDNFSAIITDLFMPHMDGLEMMMMLNHSGTRVPPIIAVT